MNIATELRSAGATRVLEPADAGYDDAVAGFDLGVQMRPAVVVDASTSADVAAVVRVAAERGQQLTVLGSGHGRLHAISDGLALTMRGMDRVEVDVTKRTTRIEAGCTWEPVLAAVTPHGLAAPCGSAPAVGVMGYLLGGGLGPLASSFGFSSDHVRSFDLVTPADGPITASADSHADLFWALRGGKGGFGVITAVTVDLLPVGDVIGGGIYFSGSDAAAVLHAYREWAPSLPETSTTSVAMLRLPQSKALPEAISGRHVVHVRFASLGSEATATAQLGGVRSAAPALLDTVGVLPYGKLGTIHGDPTAPMPVANGTASLATLGGDCIDALLAVGGPEVDVPLSSVEIRTLGAATHANPAGSDAVGGRGTAHILNVYAAPAPGLTDDQRLAAARHALDSTLPFQSPVTLVNFVGRANDIGALAGSWSDEQNERLRVVRELHDPEVCFPFASHQAESS